MNLVLHWHIFGIVAVCFPGLFGRGLDFIMSKQNLSDEQRKNMSKTKIRYTLWFWTMDLFYMSIFNNWFVFKYIFGLIIAITAYSSIATLLISDLKTVRKTLPYELVIATGIVIYLIYIIPDNELQSVVTTVVAAILGGIITLVGVSWTIKQTNKDRQIANKQFQYPTKMDLYHLILEIYLNVQNTKNQLIDKHGLPQEDILHSCKFSSVFLTNSPLFEDIQHIIDSPLDNEIKRKFLIKKDWLRKQSTSFKMLFLKNSEENTMIVYNFLLSYYDVLERLHQTFIIWKQINERQNEENKRGSALTGKFVNDMLEKHEKNIELRDAVTNLYKYYFEIQQKDILSWIEQQIMI